MSSYFPWIAEQTQRCIDLWTAGHTANEIARDLKTNRDVIQGKVHRLQRKGLCPRRSRQKVLKTILAPIGYSNTPRPVRRRNLEIDEVRPDAFKPCDGPQSAPLGQLNANGCKWITETFEPMQGDVAVMCGAARADGSPYCDFHRALTLRPDKRKKQLPAYLELLADTVENREYARVG